MRRLGEHRSALVLGSVVLLLAVAVALSAVLQWFEARTPGL